MGLEISFDFQRGILTGTTASRRPDDGERDPIRSWRCKVLSYEQCRQTSWLGDDVVPGSIADRSGSTHPQ